MDNSISTFEPEQPQPEQKPEKPGFKSYISSNLPVVLLTTLIVIGGIVLAILLVKHLNSNSTNRNSKTANTVGLSTGSSKKPTSPKTSQPATSTVISIPKGVNKSEFESIIASINTYNITGLKEHFASTVKIVDLFNGTNQTYSGNLTNQELAVLLNGASAPWQWGLPLSQLENLENGNYGQYFNNSDIIGTSTNGYIISLQLDSSGNITEVFIAPTSSVGSATVSDTGSYHPAPTNTGNGGD